MSDKVLHDKILKILMKSKTVEEMVFDRETLDNITEVLTLMKSGVKSNKPEKVTFSKSGQWSIEKAEKPMKPVNPTKGDDAPTINYKDFAPQKEDVKAREAKAPTLTYNYSNPNTPPVRTPGADEVKTNHLTAPHEEKMVPAAKPNTALNTIRDRQAAQTTEPPRTTPRKKV